MDRHPLAWTWFPNADTVSCEARQREKIGGHAMPQGALSSAIHLLLLGLVTPKGSEFCDAAYHSLRLVAAQAEVYSGSLSRHSTGTTIRRKRRAGSIRNPSIASQF